MYVAGYHAFINPLTHYSDKNNFIEYRQFILIVDLNTKATFLSKFFRNYKNILNFLLNNI